MKYFEIRATLKRPTGKFTRIEHHFAQCGEDAKALFAEQCEDQITRIQAIEKAAPMW